MLAALAVLLLGSCTSDYVGPPGHDYDPSLVGVWELTEANGNPVSGYAVNYLQFYAGGSGWYYYYAGGRPYKMQLRYAMNYMPRWNQLYITYADGQRSTMNYDISSSGQVMRVKWYDHMHLVSYTYQLVDNVPDNYAMEDAGAKPEFRPGR